MKITLKINEFMGQDDKGRYMLQVDAEEIAAILVEHPNTFLPIVLQDEFLKKHPKAVSNALANNSIRNHIFQCEMQRRAAMNAEEMAKAIRKQALAIVQESLKKISEC